MTTDAALALARMPESSKLSPMRALLRPLAAALAATAFACATNPVTGRQEISLMSPERETATGQQAAKQVEREIGIVRDPKLTAYVTQIGERMAKLSPRQDVTYRFAIADMAEPNAFALPGGWIYVSRGLLVLANDEDQLAGVIGHEIGHVAARHSAQRETRAAGVGLLSMLGTIGAAVLGGGQAASMVSELGKVAGAGVIASYGRDQERQADTIGQDLAAAAGWDPEGIADFLATLEREGQLRTGKSRQPTFLDSHPMPGERSVTTRERAPTLPRGAAPRIAKGRTAYLKKVEGLMVGPDPAEGGFEGGRFVHPGLGFSIEFPRGWATQNQKQMVGAISKRRDAVTLLELAGPTGDPRAAAQRWAQSNRVRVARSGALSIGGYAAHRVLAEAQSQQGVVAADVFFIAHPKGTFRLTNLASMQGHDAWAPTFERTAASFRSITQAERNRARPLRLRLATARAGETLVTLGKRSGNAWSAQETAVQNQIDQATPLRAGQIVKVAVRQ